MRKWFSVIVGLVLLVSLVPMAGAEPPEPAEPPAPEEIDAADVLDCTWFADDFEDALTTWAMTGTVTTNNWHILDPEDIDIFGPNEPDPIPKPNDLQPDKVQLGCTEELEAIPDGSIREALPAPKTGSHYLWFGNPEEVTRCNFCDTIGSYADDTDVTSFDPCSGDELDGYTSSKAYTGTVTSQEFLIPERACGEHIYLMFNTWWEIESVDADDHDLMLVQIDDGTGWDTLKTLNPDEDVDLYPRDNPYSPQIPYTSADTPDTFDRDHATQPVWVEHIIDVSAYYSETVQIRFSFDTDDGKYNGFRGWVIEDVKVASPIVHGYVQECDGDPLEDATVVIEGTAYSATTDEDGFYMIFADDGFPLPEQDEAYDIVACKAGYECVDIKVEKIDMDECCEAEVNFVGKNCLPLYVEPPLIWGYVYACDTEAPIEGAEVCIEGMDLCDTTNVAGIYEIFADSFPLGQDYDIIASADGYDPVDQKVKINGWDTAVHFTGKYCLPLEVANEPQINFVPIMIQGTVGAAQVPAVSASTGLEVMNLGQTQTFVDIWYYSPTGAPAGQDFNIKINGQSSHTFYPISATTVPASAVVVSYLFKFAPASPLDRSATGYWFGQRVSTIVNRITPPGGAPAASYTAMGLRYLPEDEADGLPGIGQDTYWIYAPLVQKNNNGWNSTIWVQNATIPFWLGPFTPVAANVDMYYYDQGGNLLLAVPNVSIAPWASRAFQVPPQLPDGFVGSAWIRSNVPIAGVCDEYNGATLADASIWMSYRLSPKDRLFAGPLARAIFNFGPLIFSQYNGWESGIVVLNTSETLDAVVKLTFRDTDGTPLYTGYQTLQERSSWVMYPLTLTGMPADRIGSVEVVSEPNVVPGPGFRWGAIVSVVNQFNPTEGKGSAYNTFRAYCLDPATGFDWSDASDQMAAPLVMKYNGGATLDTGWSSGLAIMHTTIPGSPVPAVPAITLVDFFDAAGGPVPFFRAEVTIPGGTTTPLDLRWFGGNTIPAGFVGSATMTVLPPGVGVPIPSVAVVVNELLDPSAVGDSFMTYEGFPFGTR